MGNPHVHGHMIYGKSRTAEGRGWSFGRKKKKKGPGQVHIHIWGVEVGCDPYPTP